MRKTRTIASASDSTSANANPHRAISIVVPRYLSRMGNSPRVYSISKCIIYLSVMSDANHFSEI